MRLSPATSSFEKGFRVTLGLVLIFFAFGTSAVFAQDPTDPAPPPLKLMSRDEHDRLEAERNLKDRTKLTLDLMAARLASAESLDGSHDYNGVFKELGGFQALMDDCLAFLKRNDDGGGKILNNFKRLEISLRVFSPRLENLRREIPLRYETYVEHLIKYVRTARAEATEPMFTDSVLPPSKDDHPQ